MEENSFDFIAIGAGCAGAAAAMYATRLNLKTAIIGEMPGGLITTTSEVENWPGIKKISGPDLGMAILDHAMFFGSKFINEKVLEISHGSTGGTVPLPNQKSLFQLKTASNVYFAKTVLIATGTKHMELGVPGEKEFSAKGVSYCALCDAGFYKDKTVAVVGGGDAAAIEAMILAEKAAKVYLLVRRDVMRAEPINANKVKANPKIQIRYSTRIAEIIGDTKVNKIRLESGEELNLEGVFVAIGHSPVTEVAEKAGVALTERKEIKINRRGETNIPGLFAAGDATDSHFKQAIIASAEGVAAAFSAYEYIKQNEW